MMEKGYPWDSYQEDKREYGAQDLANAFAAIVQNGVVNEAEDFLVEPLSGNTVRVGAGTAWINGHTVSILGYEDIAIPYEGNTSGATRYGRLVLRCREETEYRDFEIVFKSSPSGETPPVEDNEVSLARIAANRASSTVTSGDIVRDVTASYGINSGVSNGAFTNIDGLIKGDQNKISRAIPGTDYMPVSGGTFTGDISKSGVIYQTIRRQKTGAPTNANGQWTTEIYQDGFCRMYCHIFKTGCTLKSHGGTSFYIVETGTSPSPGYLYVPFPDNIVLSYGAMATVSTAFGSFANIYALPTPVLLTDGSDSISCYARAIVAASGTPEPSIYNINVDFYISIAGWME